MISAAAAALDYIGLGLAPIPVPLRTKGPPYDGWQHLRIVEAEVPKHFGNPTNIGLLLGEASGGLIDFDLDCPEAIAAAPRFLPPCGAIFGRPSKLRSHWMYRSDLCGNGHGATIPMHDVNGKMVCELRIGDDAGAQTIVPPSLHQDAGELIDWDGTHEFFDIPGDQAIRARCNICAMALLAQHWPKEPSNRNFVTMAAAGLLARRGVSEADAIEIIAGAAEYVNDNEIKSRRATVKATYKKHRSGKKITGVTRLGKLLGNEQAAELLAEIFDVQTGGAVLEPEIAEINQSHAVVWVGNKIAVMDTAAEHLDLKLVDSFKTWTNNRHIFHNGKQVPLGTYWMQHPQRRQYSRLVFSPGREVPPDHYNLWRGFSVEPKQGDCSKFLAHIRDNICNGDEAQYRWVIGWFADLMQHPDVKCGTSLALRGPEGVGKTIVGDQIGLILGSHYVLASNPRMVSGRFNAHLSACLLLHCDEAFWAGDKQAEGTLKDLITGRTVWIEYKNLELVELPSYVRMLVSGNQDWLVPAGMSDRRTTVLDVSDAHIQDLTYFGAILDEMNNGGREALLYHLLHFDLTTTNVRKTLGTAAGLEQKISSLTAEQGWWLDLLARGELPWGCDGRGRCPTDRLFDHYIYHARRLSNKRHSIETQLGMFLNKHAKGMRRVQGSYEMWSRETWETETRYGRIYVFPPLPELRQAFSAAMHQDLEWDDQTEWALEPPPSTADRPKY